MLGDLGVLMEICSRGSNYQFMIKVFTFVV